MESYCQKFIGRIKGNVIKEEIGINENKYHILTRNESGYMIHQVLFDGLEILKLNLKLSNVERNMNEGFEKCFLIRIILEGGFKIRYSQEEEYILEKNQLFLSYGEKSSKEVLIANEDEKVKEMLIMVSEKYIENFTDNKNINKCVTFLREALISNDKKIIKTLPQRFFETSNTLVSSTVSKQNKLLIFSKVNEVLFTIFEVFLRNMTISENKFETLDDEIETIKEYIGKNYNAPNLLETLHKKIYINRGELSKRFRKVTGTGLYEYLKKIKLEKAYEMLKNEDKKISEIASELGYDNYGYFSKVFYEYFGLNPKEIKRKRITSNF